MFIDIFSFIVSQDFLGEEIKTKDQSFLSCISRNLGNLKLNHSFLFLYISSSSTTFLVSILIFLSFSVSVFSI